MPTRAIFPTMPEATEVCWVQKGVRFEKCLEPWCCRSHTSTEPPWLLWWRTETTSPTRSGTRTRLHWFAFTWGQKFQTRHSSGLVRTKLCSCKYALQGFYDFVSHFATRMPGYLKTDFVLLHMEFNWYRNMVNWQQLTFDCIYDEIF